VQIASATEPTYTQQARPSPSILEGEKMSDEISGSVNYGTTSVVLVQLKGKLTAAEWEEFKECLTACVKRYQGRVTVEIKGSKSP
jgi:hypothetical protein